MGNSYDQSFFSSISDGSKRSAQEILPLVFDFVHPHNVIDVGCGDGSWLSIFKEYGIQSCLGIDGAYVTEIPLRVPRGDFLAWDLSTPLQLGQTFDLVTSLEVAEHLPASAADTFVESLTSLGSVILFSAAIPCQGGTEHINEQWPEYWAELFQKRHYVVIDCLRETLWNNDKVEPWYAQNIFFFVKQDQLENFPKLYQYWLEKSSGPLSRVHPKIYLSKLVYSQQYPIAEISTASNGVQLIVNQNRSGYLDIKITKVILKPDTIIGPGETFQIDINYRAQRSICAPIFGIYITHPDGTVCYETNTQKLGIPIELIQGEGTISITIESLTVEPGNYFVDTGIFERHWSYLHDYHWHVYPLTVRAVAR